MGCFLPQEHRCRSPPRSVKQKQTEICHVPTTFQVLSGFPYVVPSVTSTWQLSKLRFTGHRPLAQGTQIKQSQEWKARPASKLHPSCTYWPACPTQHHSAASNSAAALRLSTSGNNSGTKLEGSQRRVVLTGRAWLCRTLPGRHRQ